MTHLKHEFVIRESRQRRFKHFAGPRPNVICGASTLPWAIVKEVTKYSKAGGGVCRLPEIKVHIPLEKRLAFIY